MVRNSAIAEELAQETFLRVYRHRENYTPTAKFTTYLYQIGRRLALNWLRDNQRENQAKSLDAPIAAGARWRLRLADPQAPMEDRLMRDRKRQDVQHAIAGLPERQRVALILHRFEEKDYSETARVMSCSPQAIKSMLFRAYTALRVQLRDAA